MQSGMALESRPSEWIFGGRSLMNKMAIGTLLLVVC